MKSNTNLKEKCLLKDQGERVGEKPKRPEGPPFYMMGYLIISSEKDGKKVEEYEENRSDNEF